MDALRLQATKAAAAYRDWNSLHARSAAALNTAVHILARLQPLGVPRHYEALGCGADVQQEVLARQLQAFDAALAAVHSSLAQMASAVRELERSALEAARRASTLSLAATTQRRGPEPSAAEVVEVLQDAWRMCRDEWILAQAAVGVLKLSSTREEADALLAIYQARPNVDGRRAEACFAQLAETAPRKPVA